MDAYSSFRIRDYRLLVTATFLSSFGLQMLSVAVSWDLYIQTKSAVVLGNVGFVQVAPFLMFALFAGHTADRHDWRRIMLFTQVLFLAASGLLIFSCHSVALIYACLFLTAMARAFQWPARLGLLPHVVPAETLSNAITWNSSVQEVASVSGPAVAGILLATVGSRFVSVLQVVFASLTRRGAATARSQIITRRRAFCLAQQADPSGDLAGFVRRTVRCDGASANLDTGAELRATCVGLTHVQMDDTRIRRGQASREAIPAF